MDCHGRCCSIYFASVWDEWFRRHKLNTASDKGNQDNGHVCHSHLRTADGQSLLAKSIPGFRIHAATIIFARSPSLPYISGGEGL